MTNTAVATLIAERLPNGLWHPGDPDNGIKPKAIPLPGLSHSGVPNEQAAYFAQQADLPDGNVAKLVAEAIVALLEQDHEIIPRTELAQLRAEAATIEDTPSGRSLDVVCKCNRTAPLLSLTVGRRAMVVTSGPMLKQRVDEVCRCP